MRFLNPTMANVHIGDKYFVLFLTETTKTGEGQVAFSAGAYTLSTCSSTEGENTKITSTNNSDRPKQTDIEREYTSHYPCCKQKSFISLLHMYGLGIQKSPNLVLLLDC